MGANKANPSAMILSSTMMLRHLGLESQANVIAAAVYDVIQEGKVRTADMRGERGLYFTNSISLVGLLSPFHPSFNPPHSHSARCRSGMTLVVMPRHFDMPQQEPQLPRCLWHPNNRLRRIAH
jgi:hypothetical protein